MTNEQRLINYETREILFYKTDNGEVRRNPIVSGESLVDSGKDGGTF